MGSHLSVDGASKLTSASQRLPNTQQFLDPNEKVDPLQGFNLSPPTAAVVGGGIAGVHVAYELGKLGFDVTVFEQKDTIASGETRYSLPFVGVGLIKPSLSQVRLRDEVMKGLFPSACPAIITTDHVFNSLFSVPLRRWVLARSRSNFCEDEVMFYTNNLSRLSRQTVEKMAGQHPQLQQHIRPCEVKVSELLRRGSTTDAPAPSTPLSPTGKQALVPVTTAHDRPLMVDPVGWTRTLAGVCSDLFNVRFALNERVEDFRTYLKYDTETTRSIRLSRPDPEDPGKRIFAEASYDIVVLAAGSGTGLLTAQTARLPVAGLSGVAVTVNEGAEEGGALSGVKNLFPTPTSTDESALVLLSGPCNLFGYHFHPREQDPLTTSDRYSGTLVTAPPAAASTGADSNSTHAASGQTSATDRYTITGLMSFDTTQATSTAANTSNANATARRVLARMEAFVRVMCDQELPLVEMFGAQKSAIGAKDSAPSASLPSPSGASGPLSAQVYTRAFTPDGVPIIDHCGGALNTFVCCGFGDHAMDFAPGSAKIVAQLIRHQAELLLEEDAAQQKQLGLASTAAGNAATAPLPPSKITSVEYGMQQLLNGRLAHDDDASPGLVGPSRGGGPLQRLMNCFSRPGSPQGDSGAAQVNGGVLPIQQWRTNDLCRLPSPEERQSADYRDARGDTWLHYTGNPFATNRFRGMVKKSIHDITLHSPVTYLDAAEAAIFEYTTPIRMYINREATKLARRDNVPASLRLFIYDNFYHDDEEERAQKEGPLVWEARRRVLAMHEGDPMRGSQLVEESRAAGEEQERRAREASAATMRPTQQH